MTGYLESKFREFVYILYQIFLNSIADIKTF